MSIIYLSGLFLSYAFSFILFAFILCAANVGAPRYTKGCSMGTGDSNPCSGRAANTTVCMQRTVAGTGTIVCVHCCDNTLCNGAEPPRSAAGYLSIASPLTLAILACVALVFLK